MAVTSETSKVRYLGNGATTSFPFSFRVFRPTDLVVTLQDVDGAEETLVLDTDYTVTLNADGTGSVTYPKPGSGRSTLAGDGVTEASSEKLVITRKLPMMQLTRLRNQGGYYPEVVEEALDRLTMIAQQLFELVQRTIKFPVSDPSLLSEIPTASIRAGRFLAFNSQGEPIASEGSGTPATPYMASVLDAETPEKAREALGLSGLATTGAPNAYVLTPDPALKEYRAGDRFEFTANFANTGAATLNISSLGAKSIKKMTASGKADLALGDIQQGQPVTVEYDGTDFVMVTPVAAVPPAACNVKSFGAKGDGTTDDTDAFKGAIAAVIAAGGGTIYVPKGVYRLSDRLVIEVAGQEHITLRGDGRYLSTLDFSGAASLGLYFNSTSVTANQKPSFEVHDIGLITSRDNAGTAIEFAWADANNIDASCVVHDVLIAQNVDRISDQGSGYGYWSIGVKATNARNGEIRNLHFFGELNKETGTSHGVYLLGESTAFVISDSLILEAITGIEATDTCEGLYVDNTDVVFCRYGLRHNIASGAEPQLTVQGCSFNTESVGVWTNNSQQSIIANSLFYATAALRASAWPEWTGVLIQGANSRFIAVEGCTFSKEIERTGDITNGIDFNQGSHYTASGNRFFGFSGNELTYGIQVRSGVTDVVLGEDNIFQYVTGRVANDGTRAHRQPIVQAGTTGAVASGATVSFAQAFPNECTSVVAMHLGTNIAVNVTVSSWTATGFTVHHNGPGDVAITYIATGY